MTWNTHAPGRRRRGPVVLGAIAVLILALVVTAGLLVLSEDNPTSPSSPPGVDVPQALSWDDVGWTSVYGAQVPISGKHGPRTDTGLLASGFSHDSQGAVLAAIHISTRSSGLVGGAQVFEPTITEQTTGEVERYMEAARQVHADVAERGGGAVPAIIGYRLHPSNTADNVRVDVVGKLRNPVNPGLQALMTGTLHVRWIDGDWRLVVPTGAGRQITDVPDGFSPMPGQTLTLTD